MRLSVLDLVPVRSDQSTGDALAATRRLAQVADEPGYHRYWLAEHHNMPAVAATNPPVLIAMVAAATERIRVGSGGVMLPNHAPLVVAEQFALLEAAYPGRIDLGIGRAPGHRPGDSYALRHGAGGVEDDAVGRFPAYVDNMRLDDEPAVEPASGGRPDAPAATRPRTPRSRPPVWLLGSSDYSARLAADAGCPTSSPTTSPGSGTAEALALYRSSFRPLGELDRAADLPDRQRGGRRDRGGGRPARAPAARRRWSRCAPAARSSRSALVEEAEADPVPDAHAAPGRGDARALGDRHADLARPQAAGARRDVRRRRGDGRTRWPAPSPARRPTPHPRARALSAAREELGPDALTGARSRLDLGVDSSDVDTA